MQDGYVVEVAERVTCPVCAARLEDLELEGKDIVEDVRLRGRRFDGGDGDEEIVAFGGDLVEETEPRKGREAHIP